LKPGQARASALFATYAETDRGSLRRSDHDRGGRNYNGRWLNDDSRLRLVHGFATSGRRQARKDPHHHGKRTTAE
jgi:hypothetical protein